MLIQKSGRKLWAPQTAEDHDHIWAALEGVLNSPQFTSSKRYPSFLRYVVEQTIAGNGSQIKERTIGIEVFGRSTDYDTSNDTVVRYTAGEVRKRLALYYHDHEDALLEITIPPGSYVAEFHRTEEEPATTQSDTAPASNRLPRLPSESMPVVLPTAALPPASHWRSIPIYLLLTTVLLGLGIAVVSHQVQAARATAVDRFWRPVLHDRGTPLLVPGANVFSKNPYSGTETATKDIEYPFLSVQVASAAAKMSGLLQKNGSQYQMEPANSITLNDLRDRPVILIGGYNNDWTKRLLQEAPYRFDADAKPAIISPANPQQHWQRDHSLPYAASDDYALLARFHDKTTGSIIIVVAGLGRNGTEAAAQFLTDPHYMAALESKMGQPIADQNIEAIIKINVVDGRTGAPSLQEVTTW